MKLRKKPKVNVDAVERRKQRRLEYDELYAGKLDWALENYPNQFTTYAAQMLRWVQHHYGVIWL